jgi:ribonuclease P protein component
MLPAHRRLTTELFNRTITGQVFHSPLFTLRAIKAGGKSRFAVSASKKNFKTAVSRNSVRRRVYSDVATFMPKIIDGFFVIILPKPESMKQKTAERRQSLEKILTQCGFMKKL